MTTFDEAMLAYMDVYYAGSDPRATYYHSASDPRNLLDWHKNLIIVHPNDLVLEFEMGDGWFFTDGSTAEELTSKARAFVEGFCEFLKAQVPVADALQILDTIKSAKEKHRAMVMATARTLSIVGNPDLLPPTPTAN